MDNQSENEKLLSETLEEYATRAIPPNLDLWPAIQQRLQNTTSFETDFETEAAATEPPPITNSWEIKSMTASKNRPLALFGLAAAAVIAIFLIAISVWLNNTENSLSNPALQPTVTQVIVPSVTPAVSKVAEIINLTLTPTAPTVLPPTVAPKVSAAPTNLPPSIRTNTPIIPTVAQSTVAPDMPVMPTGVPPTIAPALPTSLPATQAADASPNKIVYAITASHVYSSEIYIMNPDGSERHFLTLGWSPIFSPDGSRIAFMALKNQYFDETFSTYPETVIRTMKLDGTDLQDYCSNSYGRLGHWSPRNRYITTQGSQNGPAVVRLCDLASRQLLPSDLKLGQDKVYITYDWSADGDYALWGAGTFPGTSDIPLYYGDPDKGLAGATKLTNGQNLGNYQYQVWYGSARISPDGNSIAVKGSNIFFLSVPGKTSPFTNKTLDKLGNTTEWVWSPDSQSLLITEYGDNLLKKLDIATGKITLLAGNSTEKGTITGLDWSHSTAPANPVAAIAPAPTPTVPPGVATIKIYTPMPTPTLSNVTPPPELEVPSFEIRLGQPFTIKGAFFPDSNSVAIYADAIPPYDTVPLATLKDTFVISSTVVFTNYNFPPGVTYIDPKIRIVVTTGKATPSIVQARAEAVLLAPNFKNSATLKASTNDPKFERVVLTGSGYPPNTDVHIVGGIWNERSDFGFVKTDNQGNFSVQVKRTFLSPYYYLTASATTYPYFGARVTFGEYPSKP